MNTQWSEPPPTQPGAALPPEILLLIVEAAAPANPLLIAGPSHLDVRTLLALSRTCGVMRPLAARLLRERCVYVGPGGRLGRVLGCMGVEGVASTSLTVEAGNTATGVTVEDGAATSTGITEDKATTISRLPPIMPLQHMTALYLDPFAGPLADASTAAAARDLLAQVGGTLRRLVVRMPLGPEGATAVAAQEQGGQGQEEEEEEEEVFRAKQLLRDGLARLGALEEFVCLGSYPALGGPGEGEDAIWSGWPRLERLVLFGAPMGRAWLWRAMGGMARLGSVVLACPDGGGGGVNIKRELLRAGWGSSASTRSRGPMEMGTDMEMEMEMEMGREMKVMLVDLAYEMEGLVDTEGWEGMDPRGRVRVDEVEVPMSFYGDEERVEAVTAWVRRAALDWSIWGW